MRDITNLIKPQEPQKTKPEMLCSFEMIKDEEDDEIDEEDSMDEDCPVIAEQFDFNDNDSLTESIVQHSPKVGPEDFLPICLLGSGSFGEVYLV